MMSDQNFLSLPFHLAHEILVIDKVILLVNVHELSVIDAIDYLQGVEGKVIFVAVDGLELFLVFLAWLLF